MRQALWPDSTAAEVDALLGRSDLDRYAVFVVERRGAGLGGFAEVGLRTYAEGCASSPVAYLEGIWVDPDLRRSRLASALCLAILGWARRTGLSELASDADLDNAVSQAFHRSVGFQETQRLVCYVRPVPRPRG